MRKMVTVALVALPVMAAIPAAAEEVYLLNCKFIERSNPLHKRYCQSERAFSTLVVVTNQPVSNPYNCDPKKITMVKYLISGVARNFSAFRSSSSPGSSSAGGDSATSYSAGSELGNAVGNAVSSVSKAVGIK
jgi:hypothetical protein